MLNTESLIAFRKQLHREAELSWNEQKTQQLLSDRLSPIADIKIEFSRRGLAFIFDSGKEGRTVLFRADMDALPIQEDNPKIDHQSKKEGVAHLCGHDGHMTVLTGIAESLGVNLDKGKLILLFQPAEEIGEGAKALVDDPNFTELEPEFVFAFHNIPSFPLGSLILKGSSFSSASKGMTVNLQGRSAHAAEPENAISPVNAVARFIIEHKRILDEAEFEDMVLSTITHLKVGEHAFGTSPGHAKILITLRSYLDKDMSTLTELHENLAKVIAIEENLDHTITYSEVFPATKNNSLALSYVRKAAERLEVGIIKRDAPFKWSEDFGHFARMYKSCLFGIGSGVDHPQLHNPDYDFPDEIIEPAIELFTQIYNEIQNDPD